MKLDILAFGVHPDDVELGCGGTLFAQQQSNKKTGIIDLTEGELGTRGTRQTRKEEAEIARQLLNVSIRQNLYMADGFFRNDQQHQLAVIRVLRKYQPEIIFCNAPEDRHPDHGRAAALVVEAAFLSGLIKIDTSLDQVKQQPWRPKYIFKYIQDRYLKPDFIVDISETFKTKMDAVKAYRTQFYNTELDEPETYISSPEFLDSVEYRAKMFGKMIGVRYAEGFITDKIIGLKDLESLVLQNT